MGWPPGVAAAKCGCACPIAVRSADWPTYLQSIALVGIDTPTPTGDSSNGGVRYTSCIRELTTCRLRPLSPLALLALLPSVRLCAYWRRRFLKTVLASVQGGACANNSAKTSANNGLRAVVAGLAGLAGVVCCAFANAGALRTVLA